MPRGMSYGLLPRAPVRCRCHTTATATAKQHTTETRMEVIIIRRLLGTMIATFLLHSDCICWATSFILAHGSGKNVDHFLHGRVFTPLQPPSSVPRPPSTARFPRPPLSFCRTEIALEISSLRNEWLLGAGAWLLRRTQSICGFFFTSFCTIILISILLRHKQRRSLTSPTSCARGGDGDRVQGLHTKLLLFACSGIFSCSWSFLSWSWPLDRACVSCDRPSLSFPFSSLGLLWKGLKRNNRKLCWEFICEVWNSLCFLFIYVFIYW